MGGRSAPRTASPIFERGREMDDRPEVLYLVSRRNQSTQFRGRVYRAAWEDSRYRIPVERWHVVFLCAEELGLLLAGTHPDWSISSHIRTEKEYRDLLAKRTSADSGKENHGTNRSVVIETATLINGKQASSYSSEQLLELIVAEKKAVEVLRDHEIDSVFVTESIERHQCNMARLVEILDSREVR